MPFLNQPSHITYGEIAGLTLASYAMYKFWKHTKISTKKKQKKEAEKEKAEKEKARLAEVTELRQHIEALQSESRKKDSVVASVRKELSDKLSQLSEVERLLSGARNTTTSLESQLSDLQRQLSVQKGEVKRSQEQQLETQRLLKARTEELKGAEVFLTKADLHSGGDVITMLNALNTEIYQTAAVVAESFTFPARPHHPKSPSSPTRVNGNGHAPGQPGHDQDLSEIHASTTEIVGPLLTSLLSTTDHSEDPTLVQIAFQAGMSAYAHWIVTSWYFDEPEDDRLLEDVYKRLRVMEEQSVSGRWRSLTRSYAHRESNHEPDLSIYIFDAFINILLTSGLTSLASPSSPVSSSPTSPSFASPTSLTSPNHASTRTFTTTELHDLLSSRFGERVSLLIKYAQTLRKAIGENITSCDFETVHVGQDRVFDGEKMDDTLGSTGASTNTTTTAAAGEVKEELVLCTTDLGLLRVVRKPGPTGQVGELEESVLLKPKMVLQSGIEELLGTD